MRTKRAFRLCILDFLQRFKSHLCRHRRQRSTSVQEGLHLDRMPTGTKLVIQTVNRQYLLETREGCEALLSGHPRHCPEPVGVTLYGSGSRTVRFVPGFIGPGRRLTVWYPSGLVVRTSRVREVRRLNSAR